MADDMLTKEELEQIKRDTEALKNSISADEKSRLVEKAKQEFEKELALKKQLEEQEKARKDLEEKLNKQQEEFKKSLEEQRQKMDELIKSKAVINPENPFGGNKKTNQEFDYDKLSTEDKLALQENAAIAFFGVEDYTHAKRGS